MSQGIKTTTLSEEINRLVAQPGMTQEDIQEMIWNSHLNCSGPGERARACLKLAEVIGKDGKETQAVNLALEAHNYYRRIMEGNDEDKQRKRMGEAMEITAITYAAAAVKRQAEKKIRSILEKEKV